MTRYQPCDVCGTTDADREEAAALAAPAADTHLRALMLEVARETARAFTRLQRTGVEQSHEETVDAVLGKGGAR